VDSPTTQASAETERQLPGISARQIDRQLQSKKSQCKQRLYGQTKPWTLLEHHIPVTTSGAEAKGESCCRAPGVRETDAGNVGEKLPSNNKPEVAAWTNNP